MLWERTRNGLNAARMEGPLGGRRPKLKPHQEQEIIRMVSSGQKTAAEQLDYSVCILQQYRVYLHVACNGIKFLDSIITKFPGFGLTTLFKALNFQSVTKL
jgi:hypothetical protein